MLNLSVHKQSSHHHHYHHHHHHLFLPSFYLTIHIISISRHYATRKQQALQQFWTFPAQTTTSHILIYIFNTNFYSHSIQLNLVLPRYNQYDIHTKHNIYKRIINNFKKISFYKIMFLLLSFKNIYMSNIQILHCRIVVSRIEYLFVHNMVAWCSHE